MYIFGGAWSTSQIYADLQGQKMVLKALTGIKIFPVHHSWSCIIDGQYKQNVTLFKSQSSQ